MITKPAIQFLNYDSDPELIVSIDGILTAMTDNPNYPMPTPGLPQVTTANDEFATALANAADGGKTLTAIKNAKRAVAVGLVRQLSSYVQVTCNGDLAVLLSSGFPIQKPQHQPVGELPVPANLVVSLGLYSGQLNAEVTPTPGAAVYNWRISTAAAPNVVLQTAQTTATSNGFTGLTPGVTYLVEASVTGSAGPSDWSAPVPKMAV